MIDELQASVKDDSSEDDEVDSLFDTNSPTLYALPASFPPIARECIPIAQCTAPSIPGLFFEPSVLIPSSLAEDLEIHTQKYFGTSHTGSSGSVNQAMLFGRTSEAGSGLPPFLDDLIIALSALLKPHLPTAVHAMLFSPSAPASRQAILNHYIPGEGITPHVDLLTRFADGILAVSIGSGTVMTFRREEGEGCKGDDEAEVGKRKDFYLPERSVLVLTGDARYKWSHGIEGRLEDCVRDTEGETWIKRGMRVSITLRWLLPGADVVGGLE